MDPELNDCDPVKEMCVAGEGSHTCLCAEGYKPDVNTGQCISKLRKIYTFT